jgi:DNA modification methylase
MTEGLVTRALIRQDNLHALNNVDARSVAMVYLDPPFNSGRGYEAIVAPRAAGKRHRNPAFQDSWAWNDEAEAALSNVVEWLPRGKARFVAELCKMLGRSDLAAYLVMMVSRVASSHRVLNESGSLYLHCDPGASHYLKIILDLIFGPENFRNEIVWKRTFAHSSAHRYGPVHDTILFYTKSSNFTWNPIYSDYQSSYIDKYFTRKDDAGRYQLITCTGPGDRVGTKAHYAWKGKLPPPGRHWAWQREKMEELDAAGKLVHSANGVPRFKRYTYDGKGVAVQDIWTDINRLDAHSDERVGYDTQKPVALLSRMIEASTSIGETVLDPFCGTGTALVAAERLGRGWLGIDSSPLAASIALSRVRQEAHTNCVAMSGFPLSEPEARRLLRDDPTTFGAWATAMLGTVADRKTSTGSVTTGVGRLNIGNLSVALTSWVPIDARPTVTDSAARPVNLPQVGFVLRHDRSHVELMRAIEFRTRAVIHEIDLVDLVDPESIRQGLSQKIFATASAVHG